MVDVFFCSIPSAKVRVKLGEACMERWSYDRNAWLRIMTPSPGRNAEFQRARRIDADQLALHPIYVLTDDDCMPLGPDFISRGLAVMEAHPEFGILAAMNYWNRNDTEPYTGRFVDDDVWECHAVGGIRFCHKGIIKEWPASVTPGSYDCQHHEALLKAGYKAGYMRKVQMNHLGIGLSQHWPEVPEIEQYKKAEVVA